ncbi:MAG: ABC-type transporter, integral rane subunit [Ilumatobacteraceae bacterium]|nr:ABC-type transporter, integral rane subunit [Ilumatobacteraceae bacterium]
MSTAVEAPVSTTHPTDVTDSVRARRHGSPMLRFVVRRVAMVVPILFGVAVLVFAIVKLIPGDPVASLLGPTSTAQARAELTKLYGLDKPLPTQFFTWLNSTLHGNLGRSIARQTPVAPMVTDALKNTLILASAAFLISIVVGLALGALAAFRRGKPSGSVASGVTVIGLSMPQYTAALILIIVFAVQWKVFPTSGMYTAGGAQTFPDLLRHLVLPALTASLVSIGLLARMFRSSLLDVMGQDWLEALRSRGLSRRRITGHVIHNSLPPILTIAGLQFGYLLSGVVFVETIFSWPGLGLLIYQSISQRDIAVVQAGVLVSALVFVVVNLIVDIAYGYLDPRVRPS